MKSQQIICLILLTILINCEALDLNRKIQRIKLLKLTNGKSKSREFPDMKKFVGPFIEGLVEFLIGSNNAKLLSSIKDKITSKCSKAATTTVEKFSDLEPKGQEKPLFEAVSGKLEPVVAKSCAELKKVGFYTLVPVSKPGYTVGLAPGTEKLDGSKVTIEQDKVEEASVFYKLEINGNNLEFQNVGNEKWLYNPDVSDNFNEVTQQSKCGAFDNCDRQRWECSGSNGQLQLKNKKSGAYMVHKMGKVFYNGVATDPDTKFQIKQVGELTEAQQKVLDGYIDKTKSWLDQRKDYTDCAIDIVKEIVPDNPITNSIKVLIGVTAGRVVGNVLLGVFTLGIGNAIAETITNAVLIINGTIALVRAAIDLVQAISKVLSGVEAKVAEGAKQLGSTLPKLILAVMKFFGGAMNRNYFQTYNQQMQMLRNKHSQNVQKMRKQMAKRNQ